MKSKKLQLLYTIILPRPPFEIPPSYTDPIYRIDDAGAGRDSVASWNSVASLRSTSTPVRPRTVCSPEVDEFGVMVSPLPRRPRSDSTASETSYGEEINRQNNANVLDPPPPQIQLQRTTTFPCKKTRNFIATSNQTSQIYREEQSFRENYARTPPLPVALEICTADWTPGAEEGKAMHEMIVPQFSLPSDEISRLYESEESWFCPSQGEEALSEVYAIWKSVCLRGES
ncbi:hypothetical protein BDZ89DRAFT_1137815 [Hymenopellis radicata]|nr:hypothetical protein BDZ89DRAFT_1137815 [Hymenopellis radicata]